MGLRRDRVPFRDGDEQDALASPGVYRWRAGQRKTIKRRYGKRVRRAWRDS